MKPRAHCFSLAAHSPPFIDRCISNRSPVPFLLCSWHAASGDSGGVGAAAAASWGSPPAPQRPTRTQAAAGPRGRDAGAPLLNGRAWLHCAGHPGPMTLTSDDEFLFHFPQDVKLFWSPLAGMAVWITTTNLHFGTLRATPGKLPDDRLQEGKRGAGQPHLFPRPEQLWADDVRNLVSAHPKIEIRPVHPEQNCQRR